MWILGMVLLKSKTQLFIHRLCIQLHTKKGRVASEKIIFFSRKRLINILIQNSCNFFF